jgi:hypothetical protein
LEPPARDNDSNGEDDTLLDLRLPSNVHQYQHHGQDDEVAVALSRTGYIAPVPSSNTVSSSETRTWSVEMILYNMGLLEPPLHPNKIRLRWSSVSDLPYFLFSVLMSPIEGRRYDVQ